MKSSVPSRPAALRSETVLSLACCLVVGVYGLMIDLKGISNDEAFRLYIMNGGLGYGLNAPAAYSSWRGVLDAISPYAYQPLYFLLHNTVMSVAHRHNLVLLRLVNIFFLWVSLQGLIALSSSWRLVPRLFLLGVFSCNAYLLMHVLEIREYIVSIAFYIWSSWLVLRLDEGTRRETGPRLPWFLAYGVVLALGFYTSTWAVFPAFGQFLFLLVPRPGRKWRFYAQLALSYVIVLAASAPYLRQHPQKINIGRWGSETAGLWPQLSTGFHLVLSGNEPGVSGFSDFLCWFWLLLLAAAAVLLVGKKFTGTASGPSPVILHQGGLAGLCLLVAVAFQVGYYYKVDDLSLAARYFALHYFFLTWLVALAFNYLYDLGGAAEIPSGLSRGLRVAIGAILAVLATSAVCQPRMYYLNPYYDMFMTPGEDWRKLAAGLAPILVPSDTVVTRNFIHGSALNFTWPIANRVVPLPDLPAAAPGVTGRLVYLETGAVRSTRPALLSQLRALGFSTWHETALPSADGKVEIPGWRILVFTR